MYTTTRILRAPLSLQHGRQPRGQRSLTQVSSGKSLCLCLLGWIGFRDLATLFFVKVCMFIREAGLSWLSKFLRRKMWRGKISETEPPRFHPALVKRSRNNREVKSSQAPPPVRPPFPTPPPPPISLSSPWYQNLGNSYSRERLAGQPRGKTDLINVLLNTMYYVNCTFCCNIDDP